MSTSFNRVGELRAALADAEAKLRMAEATIQEQREIMQDLLIAIGTRKTCCKCSIVIFWIRRRNDGLAVSYNVDGSEHWPRCRGTERPAVAAAAGGSSNE